MYLVPLENDNIQILQSPTTDPSVFADRTARHSEGPSGSQTYSPEFACQQPVQMPVYLWNRN